MRNNVLRYVGRIRRNSFGRPARLSIWVARWNIWVISGTPDKLHFYSTFTIDDSARVIAGDVVLPRVRYARPAFVLIEIKNDQ